MKAVSPSHAGELVLCFVLVQLAVIVLAARLGGGVAQRFLGQSRAVGEIVTGLLLGPSLLGWLAPGVFGFLFGGTALPVPQAHDVRAVMSAISQLGLVLLMFQVGMSFEFRHLAHPRQRRAVALITVAGLALPFGLGLGLGVFSQPYLAPASRLPLGYALFMATAMSVTAVPILGRIMLELGLTQTPLGVVTITAAAANDVVGWFLLAIITSLTASAFSVADTALRLGAFAVYAGVCWLVVRPLLKGFVRRHLARAHLAGVRDSESAEQGVLAVLLALVFVSAVCTFLIGIFAIFGGFMLGVLLFDEPLVVRVWRARVAGLVGVLFLPVFFTYTGLRTEIGSLAGTDWAWCALVILVATVGKFAGTYAAARLAGMPPAEARCVGVMMNTRALMELIVLNVGYDLGVIPPPVFTMLVIMAVISTMVTTPLLRRWLPLELRRPSAPVWPPGGTSPTLEPS